MATPLRFQIMSLIQAELKDARELLEQLKRESAALSQRKLDLLADIVERKNQLLVSLEQAGGRRKMLLQQHNLPTNDVGWRNLLARGKDESIGDHWHKLERLIKDCKAANETNGKLLNRSQRSLTHLAQLLRGQTPGENLYNARGTYSNPRAAHTYAQA